MHRKVVLLCVGLALPDVGFAWDPIGDLRDPGRIGRNIEREARNALREADRLRREALVQAGAPVFADWLNRSRTDALSGSLPIPEGIRRQIGDFYPASVLARARYKVGDPGIFNLANLSITYGGAGAVTLNDIVVFKDRKDSETNAALWAHELKHIEQFMNWGVRDFGIRYLRSWNSVENEAYEAQRQFQSQLDRSPASGDFDGDAQLDEITLLTNTIVTRTGRNGERRTVPSPDYNTRLGLWLVLDVNGDRCDDLVHIITGGVANPHYAHTHISRCDGTFNLPDKLQFNAKGVANPQGDYNTALGFWAVKICGGRQVLAHNPLLPDGRNHFWKPQVAGTQRFAISNDCQ